LTALAGPSAGLARGGGGIPPKFDFVFNTLSEVVPSHLAHNLLDEERLLTRIG
jgi:hypothetical protein